MHSASLLAANKAPPPLASLTSFWQGQLLMQVREALYTEPHLATDLFRWVMSKGQTFSTFLGSYLKTHFSKCHLNLVHPPWASVAVTLYLAQFEIQRRMQRC